MMDLDTLKEEIGKLGFIEDVQEYQDKVEQICDDLSNKYRTVEKAKEAIEEGDTDSAITWLDQYLNPGPPQTLGL